MQLLYPNILYLLPLFLLVFYFIRLQQRERPADVSSLFLWNRLLKRLTPPPPPPRKKWDLITLLRALAFVILILSAAGLSFEWNRPGSKDVIVMMDCSASMASREKEGLSRYQKAVKRLKSLCSGPLRGSRITLVYNPRPAGSPLSAIQGTSEQIIAEASRNQPVACKEDKTILVEHLMRQKTVYFFTDHLPDVPQNLRRFLIPVQVGNTDNNTGWTSLDISENTLFAILRNYSSRKVETTAILSSASGEILQKKVTLAPKAEKQLTIPLPAEQPDTLILKHTARDALAFDDSVQAIRNKTVPPTAAVCGERNRFIEKALRANAVSCRYIPDISDADLVSGNYSILVLNRTHVPVRQTPGTFYILFAPAGGGGFANVDAGITLNDVRPEWVSRDSLFRNTDFRTLQISSAQQIRSCGNAALRMKYKNYIIAFEGPTFLYFAFTPSDSTIHRFPSFPILFTNLARELFQEKYSYFKTGETQFYPYNSRGNTGDRFEFPGIFTSQGHRFAVNMLAPSESDIRDSASEFPDEPSSEKPNLRHARTHSFELTGLLSAVGIVVVLLCWVVENRNT